MATVSFVKAPSGVVYATVAGYAACAHIQRKGRSVWRVSWVLLGDETIERLAFRTKREAKAHIQARFDLWETNRVASGAMLGR
jgi:hypothetical protein